MFPDVLTEDRWAGGVVSEGGFNPLDVVVLEGRRGRRGGDEHGGYLG